MKMQMLEITHGYIHLCAVKMAKAQTLNPEHYEVLCDYYKHLVELMCSLRTMQSYISKDIMDID